MKTVLITSALLAIGLYGTAIGVLAWQQRRFLYGPDTNRPDLAATGITGSRTLTVHTSDGLALLSWFHPPSDAAQPVVLYLHGNGGHIGYRAHRFARMARLGWGVLLVDYRGYGGNPGTPTETGLTEDARAAYAALRTLGIPPRRIVLWGESLGTGIAVRLAGEADVGAVLLEAPYTSIAAIARRRFPFAPVDWLLRDRFDSIGRIGALHVPVLVMTGAHDRIVPPDMGHALFAAANEPKVFWLAPDAGHNDLMEAGAFETVRAFLATRWDNRP
jgi:fermentation-respiration switch protein FrsA (DUF1100 family)